MREGEWNEKEDGELPKGIEFIEPELVSRLREKQHTIRALSEDESLQHTCSARELTGAGMPRSADMVLDGEYYCDGHGYKAMKLLDAAEKNVRGQFRQVEENPKPWKN